MVGGYIKPPYINTDGGGGGESILSQAIAYWDFTDAAKIQDGATSVEVAGWTNTNNPGTFDLTQTVATSQPLFSTDRIILDGDFLEEGLIPLVNTATFFFKINAAAAQSRRIFNSKGSFSGPTGMHIAINSANALHIRGSGSASFDPILPSTFVGVDSTIAVVFDGVNCSAYQGGVFVDSSSSIGPLVQAVDTMLIGAETGAGNSYRGEMISLLIFPTALTATEIAEVTASL